MRLVVAVAGLLFAAAPASAQYYGPRPAVPIGPPSAYDVAEIVQAMGLDPIGPPGRSGPFFVQRARDDFGRVLNVTVDARRSQVIAVEATGAASAPYRRFAGYGPYRRLYPGYPPFPSDDEIEFARPGSVMGARMPPPAIAPMPRSAAVTPHSPAPPPVVAPKPATKSATATPVPRKRPAAAPQEAAGTVEPVPAQNAPAPAPAPPSALTPVTPLE
ncbi:MAG TPA: hypothetical protein VJT13_03085 [Xanthobacteraceae bacterium]|nr:hypothetical protein [Xanthobacteraceae bacterium]